jgi:hypothetical protein
VIEGRTANCGSLSLVPRATSVVSVTVIQTAVNSLLLGSRGCSYAQPPPRQLGLTFSITHATTCRNRRDHPRMTGPDHRHIVHSALARQTPRFLTQDRRDSLIELRRRIPYRGRLVAGLRGVRPSFDTADPLSKFPNKRQASPPQHVLVRLRSRYLSAADRNQDQ